MAELSDSDLMRILELIDKSSFDYFQLTLGDLHLTVSKTGVPPEALPAPPASAPPPASVDTPGPAAPPRAEATTPASPAVPAAASPPSAREVPGDLVPVLAPMVGTFYVAPAPDAPPFVEVGAVVQADTTVGLIEAMKVFTSIVAGVPGELVERLIENAQFVEYGQPVFLVRPAAT